MSTKWVLLDETNGAKTGDGATLDHATLIRIAVACDTQLNNEFAHFFGGQYEVRAGESPQDIKPGEQVYSFVPTLADAPGASAYHDTDGNGVPVAYCAVTTCGSLLGPTGISVDASHELLEAAADPSCNLMADNLQGLLVAYEVCDPVEIQTYASPVDSGVQVSNFVLPSWFDPKAPAPYDFMSYSNIAGAVAPAGPLQIAAGDGGNYIISETSQEDSKDTFGVRGKPRKERRDTASRYLRRLMGRQISQKGKMQIASPTNVHVHLDSVDPPDLQLPTAAERVKAPTPSSSPGVRQQARTLPVSLQRRTALGATVPVDNAPVMEPREVSAAAQRAAQRFMTRKEVRALGLNPKSPQVDQQQAVLAGRRRLRGDKPSSR
jgi:hypothetical protein